MVARYCRLQITAGIGWLAWRLAARWLAARRLATKHQLQPLTFCHHFLAALAPPTVANFLSGTVHVVISTITTLCIDTVGTCTCILYYFSLLKRWRLVYHWLNTSTHIYKQAFIEPIIEKIGVSKCLLTVLTEWYRQVAQFPLQWQYIFSLNQRKGRT